MGKVAIFTLTVIKWFYVNDFCRTSNLLASIIWWELTHLISFDRNGTQIRILLLSSLKEQERKLSVLEETLKVHSTD